MEGKKRQPTILPSCSGREFLEALWQAGILPELCRRAVIDIRLREPVRIYYECDVTTKILDVDLPRYLQDAVKINAKDL